MRKLIIINIVVAALIFLFIKANISLNEKYSEEKMKTQKVNEVHLAVK